MSALLIFFIIIIIMRPALFRISKIFRNTMPRITIVARNFQANAIIAAIISHEYNMNTQIRKAMKNQFTVREKVRNSECAFFYWK